MASMMKQLVMRRVCPLATLFQNPFHNILLASTFVSPANSHTKLPLILFSSAPNDSSLQQCLQKSSGLSQKLANLASRSISPLKATTKAEQVLQFFKERGFSDAHILNLVTRRPQVLGSNVHKTLRPKLRVFEDLGIAGTHLGQLISNNPRLFTLSVDGKLLPGISFLQKMLKSNDKVMRSLMRDSRILHVHLEKKINPNLAFLQSIGVDVKLLWNFFVREPKFLISAETLIKDAVNTVDKLGVPRHSGMFAHAIFIVCFMNQKTLERKIHFFTSLGLSKEEILLAFRKSPYILTISEKKFQSHMDFLVNTLKYEPSIFVLYPQFFMTSMEARVIPRYRVLQRLQSMQLPKESFSVINMFSMSEKRFLERFVFKYGEASGLYEIYKGIGCTKPSPHSKVKEDECKETEPQ
eukprot:Gb_24665 [translate_table: standard]